MLNGCWRPPWSLEIVWSAKLIPHHLQLLVVHNKGMRMAYLRSDSFPSSCYPMTSSVRLLYHMVVATKGPTRRCALLHSRFFTYKSSVRLQDCPDMFYTPTVWYHFQVIANLHDLSGWESTLSWLCLYTPLLIPSSAFRAPSYTVLWAFSIFRYFFDAWGIIQIKKPVS